MTPDGRCHGKLDSVRSSVKKITDIYYVILRMKVLFLIYKK